MGLTGHAQLEIGDGLGGNIEPALEAVDEVAVVLLFCAHFHSDVSIC